MSPLPPHKTEAGAVRLGGVLVELLAAATTLLLRATDKDLEAALARLRIN